MKKFTFRKEIFEGRYQSFERDHTTIKLNKKEVGYIGESDWNKYVIRFAIKKDITKKDPAEFKWVSLKQTFENEKDAREYIKKNNDIIQNKLDLYYFDD